MSGKKLHNVSSNISRVKKPAKMPKPDMWRLLHEKLKCREEEDSVFAADSGFVTAKVPRQLLCSQT